MVALLYIQQNLKIDYLSLSIGSNQFRDLQKINYPIARSFTPGMGYFLTASALADEVIGKQEKKV